MNIYLITQLVNNKSESYDGAIVFAKNEEEARNIHPNHNLVYKDGIGWVYKLCYNTQEPSGDNSWCNPKDVKVELLGIANEEITRSHVILSSYGGI